MPNLKAVAKEIRGAFPRHANLLALTYLEIGRFCFVHAGIRPGISLVDQADYDLRWYGQGSSTMSMRSSTSS